MTAHDLIVKVATSANSLTSEQITAVCAVLDSPPVRGNTNTFLTVREYCAMYKLHKNTVHRLINAGKIPVKRVGINQIRILGEVA